MILNILLSSKMKIKKFNKNHVKVDLQDYASELKKRLPISCNWYYVKI